ncbi:MFS transporter [Cohnella candidum]|uniref:MFS transporter n=1 Tax=Cohnella candidum TaxID=2674991 RepID=A0A3G3K4U7_9BACL|nr:MFS transporter [Cohnella candidum]AYQ75430.1 MFS transporter [Cohnella candidum]
MFPTGQDRADQTEGTNPRMWDDRKSVRSWIMYDWANSAFATTVMAAVMPIYYQKAIGGTDAGWAFTQTASAVIIALLAPLLGAMADHSGNKKAFLRVFTFIGAAASLCLAIPGKGDVLFASLLVILGMIGFGAGGTFYDALLNDVASPANRERVSARGFAMGYLGGGVLLAVNLLLIMSPGTFGLPEGSAGSQISFAMVGVWWILFSIPLFRNVKEASVRPDGTLGSQVRAGILRLGETFRQIRHYPELWKFMIAYWFFFDGVNTVIVMATSYGTTIGIKDSDLIAALLITQFVGFPATVLFGNMASRLGSKNMLYGSMALYVAIVILGFFMKNALHFYLLAGLVGLVQGGSQATARAAYSRLIPPARTAEFNGFLTFTSRFFSFGGPLVFGLVKVFTDSSRYAILAVAFFFVAAMVLLTFVNIAKGEREAERAFDGWSTDSGRTASI